MKILFLDFDSVIPTTRSRVAQLTPAEFGPTSGAFITELCQRAHASIVISSSWREHRSREEITSFLIQASIDPALLHPDWCLPALNEEREKEVFSWLSEHSKTTYWLVLGGGVGFEAIHPHLVRTDCDRGSTYETLIVASAKLAFDPMPWLRETGVKVTAKHTDLYHAARQRVMPHSMTPTKEQLLRTEKMERERAEQAATWTQEWLKQHPEAAKTFAAASSKPKQPISWAG